MASAPTLPPWLASVMADDLAWHGVESGEDETPQTAVQRLADEMDVSLDRVQPCLDMLREQRCMLLGGSPLAMMSYSPRLSCYRASFDGIAEADMHQLSISRAGLWLTLLASEVGDLPDTADHWLIARLEGGQVLCSNDHARRLADDYAQRVIKGISAPVADPMAAYDWLMGQAIWRCAGHVLR